MNLRPRAGREEKKEDGGREARAVARAEAKAQEEEQANLLEAARLQSLEEAALEIFRGPNNAILSAKIKEYLQAERPEAVAGFVELRLQAERLAYLWGPVVQPPVTARELRQWEAAREEAAAGAQPAQLPVADEKHAREPEHKLVEQLTAVELKARLEADGAPAELVTAIQNSGITGAQLTLCDESDVRDLSGNDVGRKVWLSTYVRALAEKKNERLRARNRAALRPEEGKHEVKNPPAPRLPRAPGNQRAGNRDYEAELRALRDEEEINDQANQERRDLRERRNEDLDERIRYMHQRLGLPVRRNQAERGEEVRAGAGIPGKAYVSFLPEGDFKEGNAVEDILAGLAPAKADMKGDAAYSLRLRAKGFAKRYRSVTINVPEGAEAALESLDEAALVLKRAGENTHQVSDRLAHVRSVIRASEDLTPLEYGYLSVAGIHLALTDHKAVDT